MTRRFSLLRVLRPVLAATCIVIGWLECSGTSTLAAKIESVSLDVGATADFLYPEAVMLRGCSPILLSQQQKPSRIYTSESSSHYCIANFLESEKWEASARRIAPRVSYPIDAERGSNVLAIRFGKANDGVTKTEFNLESDSVRQARFTKVDSVRLWVKGNGSSAQLRVWLKDKHGEVFTPQRPLRLNFDAWVVEDLSFAPGFVHSHGKQADTIPDPPLVLHRISITGLPEAMHGEIRIDRLSVVGVPWHGDAMDAPMPGSPADAHGSSTPIDLHLSKRLGRRVPMSAGSTMQVKVAVKNHLQTATVARIETTIHRILGGTQTYESVQELRAGARREVSIPINLVYPGWYRAVICARLGEALSSCVQDEYFAWEAAGNDLEDTPLTFPGAMMSADLFLGELDDDLQTMKQAGVKVLRFPFRWEKIEPEHGKYNWGPYDSIFESCRRASIIPQPLVVQTPDWARRALYRVLKGAGFSTAFSPPEDMSTFGKFMENAAGRYAKYSPYWEIWNEPISRGFWAGGTNEDYVSLLRAGYNGVKTVDSTAPVLSAGAWAVDGAPERFSRYLMEHGRNYFNILAVHSHGGVHRLNHDLDDIDRLWSKVKNRPPIWLNETGVTVDPHRNDGELIRAAETVKKMVVARARGVDNFGWFIFRGMPNSYLSPYNNYSVTDESGGPRPVLLAYNNANRWLRKSRLERVEIDAQGYVLYEFRGGGRRGLVAWARDPEVVTPLARLPAWIAGDVDIYDMFGGPAAARIEMKPLTIELTGNPVFLIAKDNAQ